ncbi:unnamed protein product [Lampetra planeri]
MGASCFQLLGVSLGLLGWVALVVATATNDWVLLCSYGFTACVRFEDMGSKGLWAQCISNNGIDHCKPFAEILSLPVYIQVCRALMVVACVLGLPAILLASTGLKCIRLGEETASEKAQRVVAGGVMLILVGLCTLVATTWFPVGTHKESLKGVVNFGYSLFAGWVGTALAIVSGALLCCCSGGKEERYYAYPATANATAAAAAAATASNNVGPASHAKSSHV